MSRWRQRRRSSPATKLWPTKLLQLLRRSGHYINIIYYISVIISSIGSIFTINIFNVMLSSSVHSPPTSCLHPRRLLQKNSQSSPPLPPQRPHRTSLGTIARTTLPKRSPPSSPQSIASTLSSQVTSQWSETLSIFYFFVRFKDLGCHENLLH